MAIYEQDVAMFETKENGDKVLKLPVTRVNNVEGLGRSASTAYAVGDVVYVDNNKKVSLKCTTAGTTSSSELDVSSKAVGNTVTDGSVVWKVIARSNVLDEGGVLSITNGGTGGNTFVKSASISGKVITLKMSNGTNKTLTTQDTNTTYTAGAGLTLNGTEFSLDDSGSGGSAYQIPYATCSTSDSTGAKVATITNGVPLTLVAGAKVAVKFSYGGLYLRSITTLNVNSLGAKNVKMTTGGGTNGYWFYSYSSNDVYEFVYDGTNWNVVSTFVNMDTE